MNNTLTYKGFFATVEFSDEDNLLFGKIEGINDLIMFEGSSVKEFKKIFKEAVNDYIEICKQSNKPFNVRVKPEVHQRAARLATMKGISLNQLVQNAIEKELEVA
jgi:predicted HicB family RNase H-like nuclease